MIEVGLKPWDAAAPFLLVEEAGGRVTDFAGDRSFAGGTLLATNGRLHDTVLATITATEGDPGPPPAAGDPAARPGAARRARRFTGSGNAVVGAPDVPS